MKINEVIKTLIYIQEEYGEIEVDLQETPKEPSDPIISSSSFFIVPEEYQTEDGEDYTICNIRNWPY